MFEDCSNDRKMYVATCEMDNLTRLKWGWNMFRNAHAALTFYPKFIFVRMQRLIIKMWDLLWWISCYKKYLQPCSLFFCFEKIYQELFWCRTYLLSYLKFYIFGIIILLLDIIIFYSNFNFVFNLSVHRHGFLPM